MVSLLVATLLAGTPQSCRAAYEAVRYRDAITECTSAVPGAPRSQLPELYRFLALSFSSQDNHGQAQRAFVSLLALDPAATLAESTSPRLRADFDAARAQGAGTPVKLGLTPVLPPQVGRQLDVTVSVDDGPAKPVTEVGLTAEGVTQRLPRDGNPKLTLSTPTDAGPRELRISAFDALGGILAEQLTTVEVESPPARSRVLSWKLWGALALITGAAGAVLATYAQLDGAQVPVQHFGSDGEALQRTTNTLAVSADVAFSVCAANAIVGIVMFFVSR